MAAPVEHFHLLPEDELAGDAPPYVPPIGDVVHAIGDKARREAERLAELYRRKRRARLLQLGLVLVGAYLLLFHGHDDDQ